MKIFGAGTIGAVNRLPTCTCTLLSRLCPDWQADPLRFMDRCWVQGVLTPRNRERECGVIDDAAVTAETAQVVIRTHENAIDRARVNAQSAQNMHFV
jgi:hypothetical protein